MTGAPLDQQEQYHSDSSEPKPQNDRESSPTEPPAFNERRGQRQQGKDGKNLTKEIKTATRRARRSSYKAIGQGKSHYTNGHIDKKDTTPTKRVNKKATQDRTTRKTHARYSRPDAHSACSLLGIRVSMCDKRKRSRCE